MTKPAGIPGGLSRFRVDLAYDGTDFAGWAKQPGLQNCSKRICEGLREAIRPKR